MRVVVVLLIAGLLLTTGPSWAARGASSTGSASMYSDGDGGPAAAHTNINKKAWQKPPKDSAYPQGRNNFKAGEVWPSVPALSKPKKAICVGNDCGCAAKGR